MRLITKGIEATGEVHPWDDELLHRYLKPEHIIMAEQKIAEARHKFENKQGEL